MSCWPIAVDQIDEICLPVHAVKSTESRGRAAPEHGSFLSPFQVDRGRILSSASFRLLSQKTQMLIARSGSSYRTRLSHTLEVANTGRAIARALGANEDLVEAICLERDLGHPPFGYTGESALWELSPPFPALRPRSKAGLSRIPIKVLFA